MTKRIIFVLIILTGIIFFTSYTSSPKTLESAIFSGGRFWNLQLTFENTYGVISTFAGYTDGKIPDPTEDTFINSEHVEAVKVVYDPGHITYKELLEIYLTHIDPSDALGQFIERGIHYRPIIFWTNDTQKNEAIMQKLLLEKSGRFSKPVIIEIKKASHFYQAEEKHQHYAQKNPNKYLSYYASSGRNEFRSKIWGNVILIDPDVPPLAVDGYYSKPIEAVLKKYLTPMQFKVTQLNGTEPPFQNEYWDNMRKGIYVDIVSGEPLFSSIDKFKSGTGWPSFTMPLAPGNIVKIIDLSFGMRRVEVRSHYGDSHLGHVFEDGPEPTGLRYCINSASLRFIPVEDMENEGYGKYLKYFVK